MHRSRLILLSLCAMTLSLMAFAASSASAAPEWLILTSGGVAETGTKLPAQLVGEFEKDGTLLTKLIGLNISILCTALTITGMKLEASGALTNGFSITFTGCTVPTPTGCTVSSAGSATGTIQTLPLKGQLQTNGEILIQPKTGTTLAEFVWAGATCPLPTGVNEPINGVLWLKDCEGKAATHLVKHLLVESTAHGHTIFIGKDTAEHLETLLDGSVNVFLTGVHAGLAWGAMFP